MNRTRLTASGIVVLLAAALTAGIAPLHTLGAEPELTAIFEEPFDDNRHKWSEGDGEQNSLRIQDGRYWFQHKVEEGAWLTWKEVAIDEQQDFTIRTSITKVSGVQNYGYGLLWGLKDVDNYYQFLMSGNGYYRYVKEAGGEAVNLIEWTQSDIVRQGDGSTNDLMVKQIDQRLEFWLNGQLLAEAEAEPFFGNQIGFIVYNIQEVAIDSLVVAQPAMPTPTPQPAMPTATPQPQTIQPPEQEPTPQPVIEESLTPQAEIDPQTVRAAQVALVIGNAAYGSAALTTPVQDAQAMKAALEALGFYVLYGQNLSREAMQTAIRAFLALVPGRETAMVYFSGYAAQRRGINYLLPVGQTIRSEDRLLYEAIDLNGLMTALQQAGSPNTLIALDACRQHPNLWLFEKGLAPMSPPPGMTVAYSAAPDALAPRVAGEVSLFTRHLLSVLPNRDLSLTQRLQQVSEAVQRDTDGQQVPWFASNPGPQ